MKKKNKRQRSKGKKVSLPNDVAPITHCDDDNCYTIGAIHTINDESDYAYDMKRPKLGDAMFDEDDIFCPPSSDEQIYFDDSMPPIYDDYIDKSGFGRVSTLGSNDPTILDGVESYCDNYESGFGEVMTLVNLNPTILEECQLCIHVDLVKNMFCDSYFVEFAYDPTRNYYERGKYGGRNFHVTK